jgi:hypothetical protein
MLASVGRRFLAGFYTFWLVGCAANTLQLVRAPFVSPVVVPAPVDFRMNVVVKNFAAGQSNPVFLMLLVEYRQGEPCQTSYDKTFRVPSLAPGASWTLQDYRISDGNPSCPCRKDACKGHVWIYLSPSGIKGQRLSGPNTGLHVNWAASGALQEMTVSEF